MSKIERERERDRQTDGQTERQRQTDRQRGGKNKIKTGREERKIFRSEGVSRGISEIFLKIVYLFCLLQGECKSIILCMIFQLFTPSLIFQHNDGLFSISTLKHPGSTKFNEQLMQNSYKPRHHER